MNACVTRYHGQKADYRAGEQFGDDRVAALCGLDTELNLQTKMVSYSTHLAQ